MTKEEDENPKNTVTPNSKGCSMPTPNPKNPNNNNKDQSPNSVNSQLSSSHPKNGGGAVLNITPPINPDEYIFSVAAKIASQPLQHSDPDVWGVLTAISDKARKRHQAMNMLLTADVHCIGRIVEDVRFQIVAPAVSGSHCRIYRKVVTVGDADNPASICTSAFLKDCSTNGTYINSRKLNKTSPEAKLCHGDVISIALAPQHESAYAFVFREASSSNSLVGAGGLKRKADDPDCESKRQKGIGIGGSDGPISLDDFRSLQRSNTELRKQLEEQVAKIDSLRSEHRAATESHENELKVLKESISESYIGQLNEKQELLEARDKELMDLKRISSEQKNAMDDLNEEIAASKQSCVEANEVINSQKASLLELKALLDEEREQRREEREKALVDLKAAVQRVKAELQEEMQRLSDASTRREKEQQEVINKLQDAEKERSILLETLRAKLEDTRQKLVTSENKVRQLEAQISEEQSASASRQKRVDELELETKRMKKELQREKQAAREEAWAKVSALELEMNATLRDLDFERRRLKGAKERIMLRETQLRAFYSTTEEIQLLCAKQQEQLKAMQRTLEDEEENNDDDMLVDINRHIKVSLLQRDKEVQKRCGSSGKSMSRSSTKRHEATDQATDCEHSSTDEASITRKHDCNMKIDGNDTQEVEFPGAVPVSKDGFGSDIVVNAQPVDPLETDTAPATEGDLVATERVLETQIAENEGGGELDFNKSFVEDTMQLDEELNGPTTEQAQPGEDTQGGGSIRTGDLLASEVPGSWACSTAPSVHGENESPKSKDDNEGGVAANTGGDDDGGGGGGGGGDTADESQYVPSSSSKRDGAKWARERRALSEMIGIIAPDLKDQFSCAVNDDCNQEGSKVVVVDSGSDTEGCSDNSDDEHGGGENFQTKNEDDVEESQHTVDDDEDEETECDSP